MRSRATLWLLALLALNYDHPRERVWLACTLWPVGPETGRTQAQALACLRQRLSELRDKLDTQAWRLTTPTPRTLYLDLKDAEVDLIAFDAAVRLGGTEALERAIALYRGRLLEGLPAEIATIQLAADRRKERYQEALRRQAEHALERGDAAGRRATYAIWIANSLIPATGARKRTPEKAVTIRCRNRKVFLSVCAPGAVDLIDRA